MLIKEEDTFEVKETFLKDMLTSCIPDFDWERYDYNYWDGDFQYNHNIAEYVILDKVDGIKILLDGQDGYWENYFIVFSYKDATYKVNYGEGSHGHKYKLDLGTLKSVQPKVKEVIYYE